MQTMESQRKELEAWSFFHGAFYVDCLKPWRTASREYQIIETWNDDTSNYQTIKRWSLRMVKLAPHIEHRA